MCNILHKKGGVASCEGVMEGETITTP